MTGLEPLAARPPLGECHGNIMDLDVDSGTPSESSSHALQRLPPRPITVLSEQREYSRMGAIRHNAIGLSSQHPAWTSDGRVWGRRELARCNPFRCITSFLDVSGGRLHLCSFPSSGRSRLALATTPRPTYSCIHAAPFFSTRKLEPSSGKKALKRVRAHAAFPRMSTSGMKWPHGPHLDPGPQAANQSSHLRGGASSVVFDTMPLNSGSQLDNSEHFQHSQHGLASALCHRVVLSHRIAVRVAHQSSNCSEANESTFRSPHLSSSTSAL